MPLSCLRKRMSVFRINLDLRVEVETMRKELEEKDKLLKDAYNAMEALDTERLRERSELESQLNSLRQTHLDSQVRLICVTRCCQV